MSARGLVVTRRALLGCAFLTALASGARSAAAGEQEPAAPLARHWRMIDAIAPFFDPQRPTPLSWAMPFSHIDAAPPGGSHAGHLEASLTRFGDYCDAVAARGYTHVILGNLVHLATFEGLAAGGEVVYQRNGAYLERHRRFKAAMKEAARRAEAAGLGLVIETDFPFWTPPLLRWLGADGLELENPRLWSAMEAALEELFVEVGAAALSIRVGEGGGAYDEGGRYASAVRVRSVEGAQRVIARLLTSIDAINAREGTDRRLLFRTWTIGVGELGALHTDPALYARVFEPFYDARSLVTVIKHVPMDFYAHLGLNPTIGVGRLPQIVEFQARREYEGFGLFPNYRASSFAAARRSLARLDSFAGISVWATNGGFLMPARSYYLCSGEQRWVDANVHAYAELDSDPSRKVASVLAEWCASRRLSDADGAILAEVMLASEALVDRGLYIGPYARRPPALLGLDVLPPMLWIFWTRPTTAHGVFGLIWDRCRSALDEALEEGRGALREVRALEARVATMSEGEERAALSAALAYQRSVFELLAATREVFLHRWAWAEGLGEGHYEAWRGALDQLEAGIAAHLEAYRGDPARPALELVELERMLRCDRRFEWLRVLAGLQALVAGLTLCLLSKGPVAPGAARARGVIAAAVSASLAASSAWLLGGGEQPVFLMGVVLGGHLAWLGCSALATWLTLRPAGLGRGLAPVIVAPLTLELSLGVVFAWGGLEPLVSCAVASTLSPHAHAWLTLAMVVGALTIALSQLRASGRWRGARAWLSVALFVALFVALLGSAIQGAVMLAGAPGVKALNDALGLVPSVLGDTGTGVEDLVRWPGLGAGY